MYSLRVFGSIRDVPLGEWNAIAKLHSYTYSPEYLEMMESSNTGDCCHGYVLVYDENKHPVSLTHFNIARTDTAIFASGWIRTALTRIRRVFPNFLKIRILECAIPISSQHQLIAHEQDHKGKSIPILGKTLLEVARKNGVFLVIVGAFEPQDHPYEAFLKDLGYQFAPCLPVATLDIAWGTPAAYLSSMKSYYRSKLQRHLRINQINEIRHELRDNYDDLAEVLWQQWLVVHQHATEYNGETLTPGFYKDFSLKFGARSKVLLVYSNDELVGHALLLLDGDTLRWRNFGRAKAENDSLYIYVCHKVVETAITLGVKRLDLGVTTYAIKRDFGASIVPRKIAIRVSWNIFNKHVAWFYTLLNHVPEIQGKDIFRGTPTLLS
jgi:predicted N-acyltransferase